MAGLNDLPAHWDRDRLDRVEAWMTTLRDRLVASYQALEDGLPDGAPASELPAARFEAKRWTREGGGGGTMTVMRGGRVFEKAGVNVSAVHGEFSERFRARIPGAEDDPRFWACGVSIVVHPRSPHVPFVHANTRHIVTTRGWFGGGADMTPVFPDPEDTAAFHGALKAACDKHDPAFYPEMKAACDAYFYLPHRDEPRGIGGIFYDGHDTGDWEADFSFTKDVGTAFLEVYPPIVRKHWERAWSAEDRHAQLVKRGRYVEFNLLHDRGTRFGLETGGNIEAIFMSLPPLAAW